MEEKSKLTDENLFFEQEIYGGIQRVYCLPNGYGLSVLNGNKTLYPHSFAWEIAILKPARNLDGTVKFALACNTELTKGVEEFETTEEANAFILKAFDVLEKL